MRWIRGVYLVSLLQLLQIVRTVLWVQVGLVRAQPQGSVAPPISGGLLQSNLDSQGLTIKLVSVAALTKHASASKVVMLGESNANNTLLLLTSYSTEVTGRVVWVKLQHLRLLLLVLLLGQRLGRLGLHLLGRGERLLHVLMSCLGLLGASSASTGKPGRCY